MIKVKYRGKFGNKLFQYCFGRILSLELGYRLCADPILGFPNTFNQVKGSDYSGYPTQFIGIHSRNLVDLESLLHRKDKRKIVLWGNFERYEYFKRYKDIIRNEWLQIEDSSEENISDRDVVVHIRRGDKVSESEVLPFSYYKDALEKINHDHVYICTDDPSDVFLKKFKHYNATIYHNNPLEDFKFIKSFNKIIISISTFSWWAAFLSKAKEICFPLSLKGNWSDEHPDADLIVDDEERYIYVPCKEVYKKNFRETMNVLPIIKFRLLSPIGTRAKGLWVQFSNK